MRTKDCPLCGEEIERDAGLCRFSNRGIRPGRDGSARWAVLMATAIVIAVGLGAYFLGKRSVGADASPESVNPLGLSESLPIDFKPLPPPPPTVVPVLDSEFRLSAGDQLETVVAVTDTRPCVLRGRVMGLSGGSRDVEVAVLDEEDYANRQGGLEFSPLFESGRTASVTLDVPLPSAGTYALVISNGFSVFTGKRVQGDAVEIVCGE